MKYVKAIDVLPQEIIEIIQNYVDGILIVTKQSRIFIIKLIILYLIGEQEVQGCWKHCGLG